ncbi:MAG TPA: HemK/PrmC family methyltransferase, partial [Ferruginibacter sp.]|nr:HemK/PrmC family methyltransferase [Ferruginibacter sp.]
MTIKEAYRSYLLKLQEIYPLGEATVITDRAFDSIAGIKKADIIKFPNKPLFNSIVKKLKKAFDELLQHKPIQYVLGEAWFYNLKLKVNEHVLIPRPETEELVELVIKSKVAMTTNASILDIGTGSGCIPIAIKKNLPAALVSAIEVSEQALAIAKENAAINN